MLDFTGKGNTDEPLRKTRDLSVKLSQSIFYLLGGLLL
ncbi:hypothetical protein PJ15_0827 [Acinetobacter sp. neg1]|nr:hypothetical protein PJ15_0827 [Acinetobacter sp. neg1]